MSQLGQTGKAQREQTFSVVLPTSDMRQRGWEYADFCVSCHGRDMVAPVA
jgi:hypothetical protein